MKIIALLPVKNEAWVLRHCLTSLSFCDEILAIDDSSTDNTLAILKEFNCTLIQFKTDATIGWGEYEIRNHLLQQARKRGATHIVAIDGDEMFSDAFVLNSRNILSSLVPGQVLALPWVNIKSDSEIFSPTETKVFACADDTTIQFKKGFLHIPRVPDTPNIKELTLPNAVIHFQYINILRLEYKKIWYMMSEYEKQTRSALRINATYNSFTHNSEDFEIATITQTPLPDPETDDGFWQKDKVFTILAKRGCKFFEPLDIWNQTELYDMFINEVGTKPRPRKVPRLLMFINRYKNKLVNFFRSH